MPYLSATETTSTTWTSCECYFHNLSRVNSALSGGMNITQSNTAEQPNGCVIWCTNASVYTETKNEFFSCSWTKLPKNVLLRDKTVKFYDKCHRHRAIRAMVQPRRPSPPCAVLLAHTWQSSERRSRLSTKSQIHQCCRGPSHVLRGFSQGTFVRNDTHDIK